MAVEHRRRRPDGIGKRHQRSAVEATAHSRERLPERELGYDSVTTDL